MEKKSLARRAITATSVITAGLLTLGLTSCSAGGDDSTLDVWWFEPADSAQYQSWTEVVEEFKVDHPDITVNFELKSWDQMQKSGQLVLNSGDTPDVLEYPKGNATAGAVSKVGLLQDLTEVADERGWTEDLQESLLSVGRYTEQGVMGTGKLYGVPSYAEYVSVIYNKDLLAEKGFQPPESIADFEAQMQAFLDAGVTPLALGASDYPIVHLVYQLALSQADQQWVRDFQFFEGDVDFHDEAWTFAAETVADWVEKGYIAADATGIDGESSGMAFKTGANPYFVSGSWWSGDFSTSISDFEWGTFPLPGSGLTQGSGGHLWVVPTASNQKDLAYELIDRLLDVDAQNAMANLGGVAIAADPAAVTNPVGQLVATDLTAILDNDALAYYPDWPVPGFYDIWLSESQNLVNGTSTPTQFLDTIAEFYERGKTELGF